VRAAHRDKPREEQWLIIEWPEEAEEPEHYWLSKLSRSTRRQTMSPTVRGRRRIERDYQELGLGHYEGRNWRGFHHHATLCIAAYGFLMLERLADIKKRH
jgi:SRSO17 transposase